MNIIARRCQHQWVSWAPQVTVLSINGPDYHQHGNNSKMPFLFFTFTGKSDHLPSQDTTTVELANKNTIFPSLRNYYFFFWTILVGEAHRATPIINVHNELKWGGNRTMRRKVHINCGVLLLHSPTSSPDASAAGSVLVQALLATGHDDALPPLFCAISHQQSWLHFSYYSQQSNEHTRHP